MGALLNDIFTVEIHKAFPIYGYFLIAVAVAAVAAVIIIVLLRRNRNPSGYESLDEESKQDNKQNDLM